MHLKNLSYQFLCVIPGALCAPGNTVWLFNFEGLKFFLNFVEFAIHNNVNMITSLHHTFRRPLKMSTFKFFQLCISMKFYALKIKYPWTTQVHVMIKFIAIQLATSACGYDEIHLY